jgi:hypothetical protein
MATVNTQGPLWVDNTTIAEIVQEQANMAERRRPRLWLDRLPVVPAEDEEITAIWTLNRVAADIIAPNQAARVVSAGQLEAIVHELPNIKQGVALNQQDVNRMNRLMGQNTMTLGREEFFGTPADTRQAVTLAWGTNPTTATPITDINNHANYLALTYGLTVNRITLTRTDFLNMVATTQVKNLSQAIIGIPATNAINTANLPLMRNYIGSMLGGWDVEIDDHVYRTEEMDGTSTTHVDLPVGNAVLTDSRLDGDRRFFDFASAPLTEALVAGLVGDTDSGLGGQERGPAVFATCPEDYNPPSIVVWGAMRGFPRRKQKVVSGVLTGL